ncbi:unnamed protein product [Chondrus crispus]|uniref:Uncharacterized protein n=1 Tax=Chondrus crispus TaxID=2769 RepID=R7QGR0_CHOCR|nr:unnamed protein product [Chondrus crispus]CDF37274.1 unnamed protein product [Chondrus crispus]|eukprot:XP_005717093.1 unnamed protein product [Chondrus crispus]
MEIFNLSFTLRPESLWANGEKTACYFTEILYVFMSINIHT